MTYGSIFPFNFQIEGLEPIEFCLLFTHWDQSVGYGDIVGNAALFLPYGYFGILAFSRSRIMMILVLGFVLALGLQVLQVFWPDRVPSLYDVVWNMVGASAGLLIVVMFRLLPGRLTEAVGEKASFPVLLLLGWLGYRLMPLVPSLDWQQIKNSPSHFYSNPSCTGRMSFMIQWHGQWLPVSGSR